MHMQPNVSNTAFEGLKTLLTQAANETKRMDLSASPAIGRCDLGTMLLNDIIKHHPGGGFDRDMGEFPSTIDILTANLLKSCKTRESGPAHPAYLFSEAMEPTIAAEAMDAVIREYLVIAANISQHPSEGTEPGPFRKEDIFRVLDRPAPEGRAPRFAADVAQQSALAELAVAGPKGKLLSTAIKHRSPKQAVTLLNQCLYDYIQANSELKALYDKVEGPEPTFATQSQHGTLAARYANPSPQGGAAQR